MTTENFYFYLQNRLIQTSQIGGQWYSDTSHFSILWLSPIIGRRSCAGHNVLMEVDDNSVQILCHTQGSFVQHFRPQPIHLLNTLIFMLIIC